MLIKILYNDTFSDVPLSLQILSTNKICLQSRQAVKTLPVCLASSITNGCYGNTTYRGTLIRIISSPSHHTD